MSTIGEVGAPISEQELGFTFGGDVSNFMWIVFFLEGRMWGMACTLINP